MPAAANTRPRRLTPLYAGPPDSAAADAATRIAARLAAACDGESVRALEALAAAEVNRLRRRGPDRFARAAELDAAEPARLARCRRIARRALAGTLATPAASAVAYHRESARPPWAAQRKPVAEIGGFVFHAPDTEPEPSGDPDPGAGVAPATGTGARSALSAGP